jgi:hypothetical protein
MSNGKNGKREADTVRTSMMREGAAFLARIWRRNVSPVTFEESTYVDGEWVRVTVESDHTRNDTTPKRRRDDAK